MVLLEGCQHKEMAAGRWAELSLAEQMGNIGSEVSRSLKAKKMGNEKRFQGAFERALELFDLTIACTKDSGRLKEICRAREEFCDYFLGDEYRTDPVRMMKYYDDFAAFAREKSFACEREELCGVRKGRDK